ncbi:hypothetical protein FNV43_RR06676 [Rhamnella rubrinervis]|uniref:Uncharacterized protein n=1 Tax=Rhamnella rubrinervis TaxID=2594499 RepID=A0A8K0HDD7_9ROSA|nr:hypothetical protein FNV43_RR06676 [Rhamnella rubrinervis]
MGASGKWLKSLITLKKLPVNDHEKVGDKSKKKWKLWRSSSEGFGSSMKVNIKRGQSSVAEASTCSFAADDTFTAAVAAVVRAPPKDFLMIKQEWAAIRIQTVFRGFLARRALRALRAVVRLQAIFRGRQVRKQAVVTLRCMQALVRVQDRVRARSVRMSPEGQAVQKLLDEHRYQHDPVKQAEQGWCDSPGTVSEVRAKLHLRHKAAIKRERVMAYSLHQRRLRGSASPNSSKNQSSMSVQKLKLDKNVNSPGWSWLERWMATKPWENRLMEEEVNSVPSETISFSRKSHDFSCSSEQDSVKVTRNNVTTRISARPHTVLNQLARSSSSPSSESLYDESSASTCSTSASPTLVSSNTLKMEEAEEIYIRKPSYMCLTESTKAKLKEMQFSIGDTSSSGGSNPSGSDLNPRTSTGRRDCLRFRRQ